MIPTNPDKLIRSIKAMLGLMSLFLAVGCGETAPPAPPLKGVSVAVPLQREIVDWDEFIGRFEAMQDVEIMPRVSGTIERITFREGLEVKKGQVLFVIDQRSFRNAVAEAQAQITQNEATVSNARTEMDRARELLGFEAVSKEEYEQKQAAYRSAAAQRAGAVARLNEAKLQLSYTTVRSPITGRISDKRVALGDTVIAGQTLLTRVGTVNPIYFSFDGAESFYLKYIRQDQRGERRSSRYAHNPVEIQLADDSGYKWRGRMTFVDNAIDPESGTIRAHAEVSNPDGFLVPGMFGRARLLGSGTYKALLVPDESIITDQTRKLLYVIGKDGKVAQRIVETGPLVEGLRVIREGIAPTEKIILDGLSGLRPGTAVKAKLTQLKPRSGNTAPVSIPVKAPSPTDAAPAR
ncbi:MAG: efflux RND transporter periplasmic adaptor subunit [Parasphingorhabdus sp.]|uniref:efflux RND transporter periplasmic adaptor subunit n=1 Tax=Parasphingorhabdus sp. TaxID=2709688 RepID=UPI0030032F59